MGGAHGPEDLPRGINEKVHPAHKPPNPMHLAAHLQEVRHRTAGMTPEERAWRRKWVLDQKLRPDEPRIMLEQVKTLNPLRKLVRLPMDHVQEKILQPVFGWYYGIRVRKNIAYGFWFFSALYLGYYWAKYKNNDWQTKYGPKIIQLAAGQHTAREQYIRETYPGLYEKAFYLYKQPEDFQNLGFKSRTALLDLDPPSRP